jgi:hypothetical protein
VVKTSHPEFQYFIGNGRKALISNRRFRPACARIRRS